MAWLAYPPTWLLLGALACLLLRAPGVRLVVVLAAPLAALLALHLPDHGEGLRVAMLGYGFEFMDPSQGRRLLVTAIVLAAAGLAHRALRAGQGAVVVAGLAATAFASMAALAGDLRTLYIAFDLLLFTSFILVWLGPGAGSERAGIRLAILHLIASAVLKIGLELHYHASGSAAIVPIALVGGGAWLVFSVLVLKAALLPLSAWMSDAYSRVGSVGFGFLAVTTLPVALLLLLLMFPGEGTLVWLGGVSAVYAGLLARLSAGVGPRLAHVLAVVSGVLALLVGLLGASQAPALAAAIGALFLLFALFAAPLIDIVRGHPEAARARAPWLAGEERLAPDLDLLWRRFGFALAKGLVDALAWLGSRLERALLGGVASLWRALMRHHGSEGILSRTWPTGSMVQWVGVLLLVLLVIGGVRMSGG
jgi:formate hydrogenlyase subunit 3/multisubunit Na+/H+ antiporter MnhD subunit